MAPLSSKTIFKLLWCVPAGIALWAVAVYVFVERATISGETTGGPTWWDVSLLGSFLVAISWRRRLTLELPVLLMVAAVGFAIIRPWFHLAAVSGVIAAAVGVAIPYNREIVRWLRGLTTSQRIAWLGAGASILLTLIAARLMGFEFAAALALVWAEAAALTRIRSRRTESLPQLLGGGIWVALLAAASFESNWYSIPLFVVGGIVAASQPGWSRRQLIGVAVGIAACLLLATSIDERYRAPLTIAMVGIWCLVYGYCFLDDETQSSVGSIAPSE